MHTMFVMIHYYLHYILFVFTCMENLFWIIFKTILELEHRLNLVRINFINIVFFNTSAVKLQVIFTWTLASDRQVLAARRSRVDTQGQWLLSNSFSSSSSWSGLKVVRLRRNLGCSEASPLPALSSSLPSMSAK